MCGLQWARRTTQIAVLALLVVVPALAHYDNLLAQRDEQGIADHWDTRLAHAVLGEVEAPERITRAVRGSVWTLRVGDHVISDPLAVLDFMAAARVPWDVFLLSALLPLLATALLGRVFCGWICPADLLFEIGSVVRRRVGIETHVSFSHRLKYAVLAAGVILALVAGTQVFAEIYPPRLVGGELYQWITLGVPGVGAWFLLSLLAFEIFVSRRFWCRCWLGPFWPLARLSGKGKTLRDCQRTSSLPPVS